MKKTKQKKTSTFSELHIDKSKTINIFQADFLCTSISGSQQVCLRHNIDFVGKQLCTAFSGQTAKSFPGAYS